MSIRCQGRVTWLRPQVRAVVLDSGAEIRLPTLIDHIVYPLFGGSSNAGPFVLQIADSGHNARGFQSRQRNAVASLATWSTPPCSRWR